MVLHGSCTVWEGTALGVKSYLIVLKMSFIDVTSRSLYCLAYFCCSVPHAVAVLEGEGLVKVQVLQMEQICTSVGRGNMCEGTNRHCQICAGQLEGTQLLSQCSNGSIIVVK